MERELIVTLAAWGIALGLAIWVLVPPVANLLGFSGVSFVTEAGPDDLWAERDERWISPIYHKLEAAGFKPLARVRMQMRFEGVKWRAAIVQRLYATDDALVSVYQLLPFETPRFGIHTIFADGVVFDSAASMPEIVVHERGYMRWGMQTRDPILLLEAHRRRVQEFVDRGAKVASPRSIEAFVRIAEAEWNSAFCRKQFRDVAMANLMSIGWWSMVAAVMAFQEPSWLKGALAIIVAVATHVGFRLVGFGYMTLESWMSRKTPAGMMPDDRMSP